MKLVTALESWIRNTLRFCYPYCCRGIHAGLTRWIQLNGPGGRAPNEAVLRIRHYLSENPGEGACLLAFTSHPRIMAMPRHVPSALREFFLTQVTFPGLGWDLFKLYDASVLGGFAGAVVTRTGKVVESCSPYPWGWRSHPAMRKIVLSKPLKLTGKALLLSTAGLHDGNYYHFLFDFLPKFMILRKAGFEPGAWDHVIMNSDKPYVMDSLERLGISRKKVCFLTDSTNICADELYVPTFCGSLDGVDSWQAEEARRMYAGTGANEGALLYLSRGNAVRRRVTNEAKLEFLLEKRGFKILDCSTLSVADQASLFRAARVVVSPHGAALANLVFCEPGTKVVEIINPSAVRLLYHSLSELLDLDYLPFAAEKNSIAGMAKHHLMNLDLNLDFPSFEVFLDEVVFPNGRQDAF